jgi:2-methylcitrate dehydratase PrpD
VLPAAIAMAQALGSSGRELLAAIVVGYETCARLARAAEVRLSIHPHGTWGVIGAAVAVARLKRFDSTRMLSVINQAATLGLATSRQTLLEGATVRNPFTGHSAQMGIAVTQMVEAGFTGLNDAPTAMFTTVLSERFDASRVIAGLGEEWLMPRGYMKLNPTGRYVHAAFDALDDALTQSSRKTLIADSIERIDVRAYKLAGMLKGQTITSSFGARFSIPFALATRIVHGNAWLEAFEDAAVANPTVQALARRVFVEEDPAHTVAYPATQRCDLTIRLNDGTIMPGHCEIMRGEFENPYPPGALRDKFFRLAMPLWGDATSVALYDGCMAIESIEDFGAFAAGHSL